MLDAVGNIEDVGVESLEDALLGLPWVVDGAVAVRLVGSETYALLFVVTTDSGQDQRLLENLPAPAGWRLLMVPMRSLPYTASGVLDRQALDSIGIVDADSAVQLEQSLRAHPGVKDGAVLIQPGGMLPARIHLTALLPEAAKDVEQEATPVATPSLLEVNSTRPAIAEAAPLVPAAGTPSTLGPVLVRAAERHTDQRITYVSDSGVETRQTFGDLLSSAERTLSGLRACGAAPGAYVLFQLSEPRNIVPTFWACLLGGFVPVICPVPPGYDTVTADLEKFLHVWALLDKPLIVAEAIQQGAIPQLLRHLGEGAKAIPIVERLQEQARDARHHQALPEDVAFVTLTSGSTGTSKCIALTHRNILSRARGTNVLADHEESDVILNWLPFDHIGSISDWHLRCVDLQCHMVYCSKDRVLGDPLRWLNLIARYRVTHSWAPNFAYALVNAAVDSAPERTWDLSCMKSLLTAGEAVSSATVEEFLTRLARFGLARSAVRPAFGMAELGSGITYFRPTAEQPYASLSVDRQSLTGTLRLLPVDHPRSISFTGLGTVIPGMAMRIVDDGGSVLPENTIGNLHVKGEAVTPGYVRNPEANAKVFVADGWFDTGDRGFLASGQLFLTGRSKETIIVNGANYYPGELESAAEQVPGVFVSFTAACSVRPPGARTERVALFLCHELVPLRRQAELLLEVQSRVSQKTGVKPDYLIPLSREQIPKTAIGKIQRKELVRRFESGEFDQIVKQVDCILENENTVPNWFLRPAWRPTAIRGAAPRRPSHWVVLADQSGVADRLCEQLASDGVNVLRISPGREFSSSTDSHWQVDWTDTDQIERLCAALWRRGVQGFELVDMTGYASGFLASGVDREALAGSLDRGCFRTLGWLQLLARHQLFPACYWMVACGAQPGAGLAEFEPGRALTISLLKALEQAEEKFKFRHIDVRFEDSEGPPLWRVIYEELNAANKAQQIAYRKGSRLVNMVEVIDWDTAPRVPHPLFNVSEAKRGFCLVTGGLGGLGIEVASLLLRRGLQVLLVGRSASPSSDKLASLGRLGSVMYQQADVSEPEQLANALAAAQREWSGSLVGIFHLAGIGREALALQETQETLGAVLAPKVFGTWAIERILDSHPTAYCVLFSSAVTTVDTSQTFGYSMANAYLDGWAVHQRSRGRLVHCFDWGPWENVGMNTGWTISPALRARGLEAIPLRAGMSSLLAGLGLDEARIIVGLNPNSPRISPSLLRAGGVSATRLDAFFARGDVVSAGPFPEFIEGLDAFGCPLRAHVQELSRLPLDSRGQVDHGALAIELSGVVREKKLPKTATEKRLAKVFAQVLGADVGVNESFFDLGGTSILSLNLFGEIEREFGVRLPAATLFESPTVEQISAKLDQQIGEEPQENAPNSLMQISAGGPGPALFLVHDADGETILYRGLALALAGTPVFALAPHGDENFPALDTSIEEMSQHYIGKMREIQPQGPYMVGGLCAGGVIAFDIACRLQAAGEQVAAVVLLDAADSQAPIVDSTKVQLDRFTSVFKAADQDLWNALKVTRKKIHNFVKYESELRVNRLITMTKVTLLREMRQRGMNLPSFLRHIAPRSVYQFALKRHQPGTFAGKLLLFRATKGDASQRERGIDDTPAIEATADPLLGWSYRATNGVEIIDVPGGHSSMLQEPNVAVLAEHLRERIRRALPETTSNRMG